MDKYARKPSDVLLFLATIMILSAVGLTIFGGVVIVIVGGGLGLILALFLWLAAADLVCSVFRRPLIKAGPIAKLMYPSLSEDEDE